MKSYCNRPTNCPFSLCKLLDQGFIQIRTLLYLASSQSSHCLVKTNLFVFMDGVKGFFCSFKCFLVEIMNKTPTNSYMVNICAFYEHSYMMSSAARIFLLKLVVDQIAMPNQFVIMRAFFSWFSLLFLLW